MADEAADVCVRGGVGGGRLVLVDVVEFSWEASKMGSCKHWVSVIEKVKTRRGYVSDYKIEDE